ncbi:MAG: hypothetical protein ACJAXS_001596 [Colwellia sp.]|jgi:hypothetical protein
METHIIKIYLRLIFYYQLHTLFPQDNKICNWDILNISSQKPLDVYEELFTVVNITVYFQCIRRLIWIFMAMLSFGVGELYLMH